MPRDSSIFIASAVRLRGRREAVGLTQAQVAERLGVDTARYRNWEKVFGLLPQRQHGDALARILDIEAEWLCSGVGEVLQPSEQDYEVLGQRAATRRRTLKLSRVKVAKAIGINMATLNSWEDSLPARYRGEKEHLWEDALQVPRGWLRDETMTIPSPNVSLDLACAMPVSVANEILAVGTWLARASERSRTVHFEELTEAEQRRATMFADRYGVSGPEKTVLQVIGNKFNLTRERVRQVVDAMTARARGVTLVLPRLSQLREAAPLEGAMSVAEFETKHRALLGPMLSLADADCFAREILGLSVASMTERSHWQSGNALQPMLLEVGGFEMAMAVRDASRKMIRSCGAAHVMFVTGMVSAALGEAVSIQDVCKVLTAVEGMEWLTVDEDWYWLGMDTSNNRVLDIVRKVLAVAARRLDIEDLHQAVCRSRRLIYDEDRTSPPAVEVPKHVLREILVRVPWLSVVQFDDFLLTESVAVEETLSSSELAVAEVIRRHGGAVARQIFNKELVATGFFSVPNLQIILSRSPIIRPLGFGIYGLRGVAASEKSLSAAMVSVGNAHSLPSTSDADGWHEFEITITEFKLRCGIVDFPTRVVSAGKYQTKGVVNGLFSVGAIPSAPQRVTGFVTLLRKAGIQPSDVLRVRIHPGMLCAEVSRAAGKTGAG